MDEGVVGGRGGLAREGLGPKTPIQGRATNTLTQFANQINITRVLHFPVQTALGGCGGEDEEGCVGGAGGGGR